jgi:preprotein translocase subunit SecA
MNQHAEIFSKLNETELPQKLLERDNLSKSYFLSLLREAIWRLKGEWLRPEQALAILLALNGESHLLQIDTSEGKTLIIALLALMKRFLNPHKKIRIITHTEAAAHDALKELRGLAELCDIKIGKQIPGQQDNHNYDIACVDIANAVLCDLCDKQKASACEYQAAPADAPPPSSWNPHNYELIIDEVDNVFIDVAAKTRMQISGKTENTYEGTHEDFIRALDLIYTKATQGKTVEQIQQDLHSSDNAYLIWLKQLGHLAKRNLAYWITAAHESQNLYCDQEYTIYSPITDPVLSHEWKVRTLNFKRFGYRL